MQIAPELKREEYDYHDFRITISESQNHYEKGGWVGVAIPLKYIQYYSIDDFDWYAEAGLTCETWGECHPLIKNGINIWDEDGYYLPGEIDYIEFFDDPWMGHFTKQNVLETLTYSIRDFKNIKNKTYDFDFYLGIKKEFVVLKEISKPKNKYSSKSRSGFKHVAWSTLVKERDQNSCTKCGSAYELHAHHVKSYKMHPELRYDVNNGITLCSSCHRKHHKENGR